MESLIIKKAIQTPEIIFDCETGKLLIAGRSYSSNSFDFYRPVTDWVNEYVLNPQEKTVLDIDIDYFHSVSVKYLTTIIKKLEPLENIQVRWILQEEDRDESFELGKIIERGSKIKFDFI
jgi:SiaC family regulatory phosphoprotein